MNTNGTGKAPSALSLLRIANRRKLYLILPMVLLTPAVAFYASKLPKKFRARTLVGAEALIAGQPGFAVRVDPGTLAAQEQLRAIRETLLTPTALATVRREFDLTTPSAAGPQAEPAEELKSRVKIQLEGANAFYIGFEGSDAKLVMDVANRLAEIFVERASALRGQRVAQQENVLDSEVARLRGQLAAREDALRAYKEKASQDLPERLGANLKEMENLQQQIQSKSDQITEAEARKASILEEMDALEKQGVLKQEPAPKTPSQIVLDDLRMKLGQLRTKYTPEYPDIKRLQKEIHDLEAVASQPAPAPAPKQPSPAQMRYFALQAELKPIEPRAANYSQERDALLEQLKEYQRRINFTPGHETTVAERTRDAAMLRARYEALYAKQQEARLNRRSDAPETGPTFKVLERATLPAAPYSPHTDRLILFATLAGLALGVAGAFIAERTNTSFETSDQVEAFTTIPVVATVPGIPTKLSRKSQNPVSQTRLYTGSNFSPIAPEQRKFFQEHRVPVLGDPQAVSAQQYGSLAVRVQQRLERAGGKTLVITSATGQEGKSVTALNLALALAATADGRVLLVDCDLRLPQVRERLGLKSELGLSDLLLSAGRDITPFVSSVGGLDVIPGGARIANPLGLLASPRFRDVIAMLKERYQLIVFDSPPMLPIPDSHILAGLADGVLLVVRARKTRRELFQRVVESMEGANVIGLVLNDVDYSVTSYVYAYRYYQRHYLG